MLLSGRRSIGGTHLRVVLRGLSRRIEVCAGLLVRGRSNLGLELRGSRLGGSVWVVWVVIWTALAKRMVELVVGHFVC